MCMLEYFFGKNEPKDTTFDDLRNEFKKAVNEKPQNPEKIADLLCSVKTGDWPKIMQSTEDLYVPEIKLRSDGTIDFKAFYVTVNSEYCKNRRK